MSPLILPNNEWPTWDQIDSICHQYHEWIKSGFSSCLWITQLEHITHHISILIISKKHRSIPSLTKLGCKAAYVSVRSDKEKCTLIPSNTGKSNYFIQVVLWRCLCTNIFNVRVFFICCDQIFSFWNRLSSIDQRKLRCTSSTIAIIWFLHVQRLFFMHSLCTEYNTWSMHLTEM